MRTISVLSIVSCFGLAANAQTWACRSQLGEVFDLRKTGTGKTEVNVGPWQCNQRQALKIKDANLRRITATTDLKTLLTLTTLVPETAPVKWSSTVEAKYTCDHVVEINMLKRILEMSGGACDEAAKMTDAAAALTKLKTIRLSINTAATNLHFLDKVTEGYKGAAVQVEAGTAWATQAASWASVDFWHVGAIKNYLKKKNTLATTAAAAIDVAIKAQFPNANIGAGVTGLYVGFVAFIDAEWEIKQAEVKTEIAELKKKAAAAKAAAAACKTGSGSTTPPKPPVTRNLDVLDHSGRMVRRSASAIGFTPISERSSLTRRAPRQRGAAARSGPHAPPCPSCPAPGQAKKVVPRSKTKQRAPPAKAPRRPYNPPAKRAPNPRKQVARRPANRPLRAKGVAKPKKRITPKKKPKKVPKPPRKPKGKARPRRR